MAHTSRGIWYPSTSDSVRPASRDFKDAALTTNAAIDAAVQEAKWTRRPLNLGEDLNALLEPGVYWSGTYSLTESLVNRPTISDAINRATVEVITDGNGGYSQTWVTYNSATSASSPTLSRRRDENGRWTEWASGQWGQRDLALGEDMDLLLKPGLYQVRTYAVAESLVNGPQDPTAINRASVEVTTDGNGSYTQKWTTMQPASVSESPTVSRRRDEIGRWTGWEEPNFRDIQPYAGLGGVAAHQSQEGILRIIAGMTDSDNAPWRWSAPVGTRITTPTHDGSGQGIHPSVLYFPQKWNGWHYWMAMTPYPYGNEDHEDPEIVVSDDGDTWQVPDGLENPLDDQPGRPGPHNSDTHLVQLPDGRLMVTWRMVDRPNDDRNIFYQRISADGITWTPKQVIFRAAADHSDAFVSQALVRVDGGWRMYGIRSHQIVYFESTEDIPGEHDWSPYITCTNTGAAINRRWWHIDVQSVDGRWWLIVSDRQSGGGDGNIYLGTSDDGVDWTISPTPLVPNVGSTYDSLYKTGFVLKSATSIDVWYSGYRRDTQEWATYRTTASLIRPAPTLPSVPAPEVQDTGWRDISSLLNPGWTGTIHLRRVGPDVHLEIIDVNVPADGIQAFYLPTGFRPHHVIRRDLYTLPDYTNKQSSIGATGYFDISGARSQTIRGHITFLTDQDFPTTYPGTPV